MKVNVYQTVEVSDEQRVMLGALIDGVTTPKRQAARDEIKEFVWENGADWEVALTELWTQRFDETEDSSSDDAAERAARAAELAARVEAATEEDEDLDGESLI